MKKYILSFLFACTASLIFAQQKKIAIVFDAGGKFDKGFNQSAWEGGQKAQKDLKIDLKTVEPANSTATEEAIRNFASQGYDLVIGVGFLQTPHIEKVATEFPKINFAIVDSVVEKPNVASLVFKEQEGSFLVGAIAAMRARDVNGKKVVGFIGGMDIPLIHKFEVGYKAGAKHIDPKIEVLVNYVGNTPTAWNDPAKAKEIANAQIAQGASVIYAAAGASGNGLLDAIKEKNGAGACLPPKACIYAIGVDSNQNYLVPGQVLTSMTKRVDVAVYDTIKAVKDGKFKGGVQVFGLESRGVGYALDQYNKQLISNKMIQAVEQIKKDIIAGKIKIPAER